MKSVLLESQYTGSCSYWSILLQSEKIILDRHEHFVKRSYRNRAHILGANGLLRLSIPLVHGKHQHAAMKDIRISYNENWQKLHWQSLTSCYRRSPFFEFYEDAFRRFYEDEFELLTEYNYQLLQTICGILKTEPDISFSDNYYSAQDFNGTDYRNYVLPSKAAEIYFPEYPQVFSDRFAFQKDLSVLDVLFNLGSRSKDYLLSLKF